MRVTVPPQGGRERVKSAVDAVTGGTDSQVSSDLLL
jgi:hypothetical protein